ncbi:MAG: DUF2889 domain-containing protein [Microthrixaceae bacterium]|nr:DUF2889 domain-containing protein [Microthrixaceae bacterium]MCO5311794.1 DUF2889 domain-containing protein [Microthrixaceae bacterium]
MGFTVGRNGPQNPLRSTPVLAPGWTRWTFHADSSSPNGLGSAPVRCEAVARSVRIDTDRQPVVEATVTLSAETDAMARTLSAISVHDSGAPNGALELSALVGHSTAGGFRARLDSALRQVGGCSALAMFLLDDLPGITLVGGYAEQYEDSRTGVDAISEIFASNPEAIDFQADTCAGWAEEATLISSLRNDGEMLTPVGPPAPALWTTAHTQAPQATGSWHPIPPLSANTTRRVRRIDLGPDDGGERRFETHFRDSHADFGTTERVLHEYLVRGTLRDGVIADLDAEARVLPWMECPSALASAQRCVGQRVGELRSLVRHDFRGTSTCTHLNDTIRSLDSIATMGGLDAPPHR